MSMRALMMLRDSLEERKKRIEQRRREAAAPPGSLLAGNSAVIGAMNVIQQHVIVTGPGGVSSEDEVCADCGTHWKPTAKVESDELRAEIRRLRTEIDSAVDLLGELGRTSP